LQIVETAGCLHPHIFGLLRRKARGPFRFYLLGHQQVLPPRLSFTARAGTKKGPRGDLFGCQVGGGPPQGLREARAWQRVAVRPTRLDLREAFEYASRSFRNAVALRCDLRCKIKQN
jgi:hypothetical protein